jgi:hypothetical protein
MALQRPSWDATAGCLSSSTPEQRALQLGWDCALNEISTEPVVVLVAQAAVEAQQPLELLRCAPDSVPQDVAEIPFPT